MSKFHLSYGVRSHFRPIDRDTRYVEDKHRRIAVRIARHVGLDEAAWLFDVQRDTVRSWWCPERPPICDGRGSSG